MLVEPVKQSLFNSEEKVNIEDSEVDFDVNSVKNFRKVSSFETTIKN